MPELRANGVSLYYEEHGAGEPILCIHGTGSTAELWAHAAEVLGTRGRAIVYDRRGFSRSERPEPFATDVRQQADDAAALLDGLAAAPAVVVGRSQGGEIAVDLALRHAGRVRALVLLEGGGLLLGDGARAWLAELDEVVFAAGEEDVGTVGEAMFRGVLGDDGWDRLDGHLKRIVAENGPAILAEHRGGLLEVTPDELAVIECPTLVVGAEESPAPLGDSMRRVADAIPGARLERVGGDHMIDPTHPSVLAFVDEVLAA